MLVVGLSHHTAPIAVRERLAVTGDALLAALDRLRACDAVKEVVLLSTCNRVEVYAAGRPERSTEEQVRTITAVLAAIGGSEVVPHLFSAGGPSAVQHLFRVACSLDSLVVGEPQILGQLKEALRIAQEHGTVGRQLAPLMRAAVHVAKRVRTDTDIGGGQVSVPTVAVELANRIFDDLSRHRALLIGAGEMAEAAARLLARQGANLMVVNRSPGRAADLAAAVGGEPRPWAQLDGSLLDADIVVTSTASPEPIITRSLVKSIHRKRRGRSLFVIDIAVPRDVEPSVNELENVYLYDIDDLSKVVARSLEGRAAEAGRAEAIVRAEAAAFLARRSQDDVKPVIVGLRERVHGVLQREMGRSLKGKLKHLSAADRRALDAMLQAAVNKLLHSPTVRLKELAMQRRSAEAVEMLSDLFDLDEMDEEESSDVDELAGPSGVRAKASLKGAHAEPEAHAEEDEGDLNPAEAADPARRVALS